MFSFKVWRSNIAKYGITPEQFFAMVKEQDNRCKICKREAGKRRLHIDHCHTTGKIRGLLCSPCNTSLGGFRDDPELLRAAIQYLEENRDDSEGENARASQESQSEGLG